jgi:lipoprotein-anchoring transpeptidase ErfK/SrfK
MVVGPNQGEGNMRSRRTDVTRPGTAHRGRRAFVRTVAALALVGALGFTAACGGGGAAWRAAGEGGGAVEKPPIASATVTSPAADATDVPTVMAVTFETKLATESGIEVTDPAGAAVKGTVNKAGTRWVPAAQLKYATTYTITVTATGEDDKTATATSAFTTMGKPDKQIRVSSFLGDGAVVGVGMPLIVRFSQPVPKDFRDDVQRRMTVHSEPKQVGAWHWVSGTEVRYRPKTYWKANTRISYHVATSGLPMGDGWYGRNDLTVGVKTGSAVIMTVDDATKQMTVKRNGKVLRTIPVSLGKATTPSSSGTMLIIQKYRKTVFDTLEELGPEEGYRIDIEYAQRLTWGGEYIHAAPWSVAQQGHTNVSHGCVNVSMSNAEWLFGITKIGDPVTVKGTERKLQMWNGWTDWNFSWQQWIKGSALPVT